MMKKIILSLAIAMSGYCTCAQTYLRSNGGALTGIFNLPTYASIRQGLKANTQKSETGYPNFSAVDADAQTKHTHITTTYHHNARANEIPINTIGTDPAYLPLSGGTLTGPLSINSGYFAFQTVGNNIFASGSTAGVIGSGSSTDYVNYVYGNNPFSIWTNNQNRLTIDGSGKVGIGTASPAALLHVAGTTQTDLISFAEGTNSIGYLGRGLAITGAFTNVPDALALTYVERDLAIGGWSKTNHTWSGVSLFINSDNNNVGIGTTTPDAKLSVLGTIHTNEVKVDLNVPGPDYVFDSAYKLTDLGELKTYLEMHHHLPEIPSAEQMKKDGLNLGEMNTKLLKKVEELTLYVIQLKEQNKKQKDEQESRIIALEKALLNLTKNQSK